MFIEPYFMRGDYYMLFSSAGVIPHEGKSQSKRKVRVNNLTKFVNKLALRYYNGGKIMDNNPYWKIVLCLSIIDTTVNVLRLILGQ